jgi:hypothetical protein
MTEDAMTRDTLPLPVADLSAFARQLRRAWPDEPPGHLTLMNLLARASGFRNLQHLRANMLAEARLSAAGPVIDHVAVEALRRCFDAEGRLMRWPARTSVQHQVLWVLWSHLPRGEAMTERQISDRLNQWHLFGDAAIIRRTLLELGLLTRTPDCTEYRRVEQKPPPEILALIRLVGRSRPTRRGAARGAAQIKKPRDRLRLRGFLRVSGAQKRTRTSTPCSAGT